MRPRIDHLDITVKDLDREEVFYDALLPLLGFELTMKAKGDEPAYEYRAVDYSGAEFSLSLICPRPTLRRRPSAAAVPARCTTWPLARTAGRRWTGSTPR